jgi:hypothetical protein
MRRASALSFDSTMLVEQYSVRILSKVVLWPFYPPCPRNDVRFAFKPEVEVAGHMGT